MGRRSEICPARKSQPAREIFSGITFSKCSGITFSK